MLRAAINMGNFLLVTGKTPSGDPTGVSPDMAAAVAARLGVPVKFVPYERPGQIADDAENGKWDIGNIGAEPQRAAVINFTAAYCEIEATYLVPAGSPIRSVGEVDQPGTPRRGDRAQRLRAVARKQLQARANCCNSTMPTRRSRPLPTQKMDAYAGLRPGLIDVAAKLPGSRILDGQFTAVQQAVGTPKKNAAGVRVPARFCRGVEEERPDREPDRTARRHRPPVGRAAG